MKPIATVDAATSPVELEQVSVEPAAALAAPEDDLPMAITPPEPRHDPGKDRSWQPGVVSADAINRFADVVSGRFDEDESTTSSLAPKRILAPVPESPKLHKVLAQAGMGSRLEMEQLIMEGRITVNNEPAHIGQRIQFGDHVKVNGKPIRFRVEPAPARVIAYHKPTGEVVSHDDPQNRPTVFRRLPKLGQGKWQSVGRLDLNTEGLLLLTNSGELANNLMHPRFGLEREYAVRVLGALSREERQQLLDGVKLEDGLAHFTAMEDGGGEGANCWYRVTIAEGRNREVRRMFEAVGHAVSRLIRIRYGAMMLPRGLKRGAWMELDQADIRSLTKMAGLNEASGRERPGETRRPGKTRGGAARRGPRGAGPGAPRTAGPGQAQGRMNTRDAARDEDRLAGGVQPDPMRTAFGYIGADSFTKQRQGQRQDGRRGNGNGNGNAGGSGAPRGPRKGARFR